MFCPKCGQSLIKKIDGIDGEVDYCEKCLEFRYPMFASAISAIVILNKKILLIKQYKRNRNILVAGYVSKGETLEETLKREINEEVGLQVERYVFNASSYFAKSNSLISNFVVYATGEIKTNEEVDDYALFTLEEAIRDIAPESLAEKFLHIAIEKKIIDLN